MAVSFTNEEKVVNITLKMDDSDYELTILRAKEQADQFVNFVTKVISNIRVATLTKDFVEAGNSLNVAMEQYQRTFEILLKSSEEATKLCTNLKKIAQSSSFELSGLADSTQVLLSFGVANEDVISIMSQLVAVSLGNQENMNGLTEAYGQAITSGELMNSQLIKMIENGFNPLSVANKNASNSITMLKKDMELSVMSISEMGDALKKTASNSSVFSMGVGNDSKSMTSDFNGLRDSMISVTDISSKTLGAALSKILMPAFEGVAKENKSFESGLKVLSSTLDGASIAIGGLGMVKDVLNFTEAAKTATSLTSQIGGVAQSALSLSPTLMIAGAAIGTIVGLFSLWSDSLSESKKAHEDELRALQDVIDVQESMNEKREEALWANLSEISSIEFLKKELDGLVDAKGAVLAEDQGRVSFIVSELNKALGSELKLVDGQVEGYDKLSLSVDEMISKKRGEFLLLAKEPEYRKAIQESMKAQMELNDLEHEMTKNNQAIADLYDEKKTTKSKKRISEINDEIVARVADSTNIKEKYDKQSKIVQGYYDDISVYEQAAALLASDNAEDHRKAEQLITDSQMGISNSTKNSLKEQQEAHQSYREWLLDKYKETGDQWYAEELERTDKKIETTQTSIDAMTIAAKDKLPEFLGQFTFYTDSMITALKDKNPEMYETALDFAQNAVYGATDKEGMYAQLGAKFGDGFVTDLRAKYGDAYEAAKGNATGAEDGANTVDGTEAGGNFSDGYVRGISAFTGLAFGAGALLASKAINGTKNRQASASPSKVAMGLGKNYGEGYAVGINSMNEAVAKEATQIGTSAIEALESSIQDLNPHQIIENILEDEVPIKAVLDFENGLYESGITKTLNNMKNNLVKELNIESFMKTQPAIQNITTYNFEQTIQSAKEMSASEIAAETQNLLRRARWSS